MTRSKRQMVNRQVYPGSVYLDGYTLQEIKAKIEAWIAEYGEDARLEEYSDGWDDTNYWGIFKLLPENDEEYAARILREKEQEEKTRARELAEFERLSKKFNTSE